MSLINDTIWFIESHHNEDITLDDIADTIGVSRFHLLRAFGVATGYSVMRYLRARRLSIAAKALAMGECSSILDLAITAGYSSHEAFTRAFREQFGATPEMIRMQGHLDNIDLVEPILMQMQSIADLEAPRILNRKTFLVAGLRERYSEEASRYIPAQWQSFAPYFDVIDQRLGDTAYGVCYNNDDIGNIDYMCGVEVAHFSDLPSKLDHVRIPQQCYAIFKHHDNVSTVSHSWHAIFCDWLPNSQYTIVDAPSFERYEANFDPLTGLGGVEIWIPILRSTK